jgi:hypothetical protein
MASLQQRLPENVPGDFFVDSTCIDCDTCSQLAPHIFRDHGDLWNHTMPISASTRSRCNSTKMFTSAVSRQNQALAPGVI